MSSLWFPISKDEPTDVSCIVGCAVLTGSGAVMNTAQVRPGDSVAIFGVGGVGLSAVAAAAMLEAYPIIAVDLQEDKLEFAKEFGATHTVNASQTDPVQAVLDLTNGGVEYAFDTIGVRITAEQILPFGAHRRKRGGKPRRHGRDGGISSRRNHDKPQTAHDGSEVVSAAAWAPPTRKRTLPPFCDGTGKESCPSKSWSRGAILLDDIAEACDDLHHGRILRTGHPGVLGFGGQEQAAAPEHW